MANRTMAAARLVRFRDPEELAKLQAFAADREVEVLRATGCSGFAHWVRMLVCREAGLDPITGRKKIEESPENP